MAVKLKVNVKKFSRDLHDKIDKIAEELSEEAVKAAQQAFATGGYEHEPWEPESPITVSIAQLKGEGRQGLMKQSGDLMSSITNRKDSHARWRVGSTDWKIVIHEFGTGDRAIRGDRAIDIVVTEKMVSRIFRPVGVTSIEEGALLDIPPRPIIMPLKEVIMSKKQEVAQKYLGDL